MSPFSFSARNLLLPLAVAAFVALTGCEQTSIPTHADEGEPVTADAPFAAAKRGGDAIPGQYIVVFKEHVGDVRGQARDLAAAHSGTLRFTYTHALKGFAARLSDQAAAALRNNPNVASVELDQTVQAFGTQTGATWGLDRVDQRTASLDGLYTYDATGAGVTVYVLDTGIRTSHNDFGGRASIGADFVGDGRNGVDCNGHGTHVAGTVGGSTYGVAKGVNLVAVRVLDCNGSGSYSGVIAGIDWVTDNAAGPAVANMSLGGGASSAVDNAVRNSIASGVAYAVAAGNGNFIGREADACNYSPARVQEAMTIGATNQNDVKTSWSNYGSCVDWFAPGQSITSAWYTSNTATATISGTSMATPHTAGVAALYLETHPGASPAAVRNALYDATTKGVVSSARTADNHLLYSLVGSGGGTPGNNPPAAGFTFTTSDLTATFTDQSSDADGSVVAWSWNFGDGATSTSRNPTHTYAAAGTYTVTLTVTDDDGAADGTSRSVTVTSASGGGITLDATGYKEKGRWTAALSWSGATTSTVDVYRNGTKIGTTANDGAHTDQTSFRGSGTLTYRICEAGTATCSNQVSVTF